MSVHYFDNQSLLTAPTHPDLNSLSSAFFSSFSSLLLKCSLVSLWCSRPFPLMRLRYMMVLQQSLLCFHPYMDHTQVNMPKCQKMRLEQSVIVRLDKQHNLPLLYISRLDHKIYAVLCCWGYISHLAALWKTYNEFDYIFWALKTFCFYLKE